jgi:hypothetical protein
VSWILRGLGRLVLVLAVLAAVSVGIGLLLTWARGGSLTRSITLTLYVGGAVAVVGSLFPRGNVTHLAYGQDLDADVLRVPYADGVGNLLVGIGLLVIGGALDTLG